jgi:riboflavin kinase/FMN adenylyltransferase
MSGGAIRIFRSAAEVPADFGPAVVAIGNFDGVHLGHRAILEAAKREARTLGVRSVAVTFHPHPEQVLRPTCAPKLLTPLLDQRIKLLARTGLDAILLLNFDEALANVEAWDFARSVLKEALKVRAVHEGRSFRFGHGARAGVKEMAAMGAEMGFRVHVHHALRVHGLEISSSAVRAAVAAGDVRRARWMLGRPFCVLSTQAPGRGVGTRLLVPTVNLAAYEGLLPGHGVYVTRIGIGGRRFQAVTNVGQRPTFEDAGFGVETHILNFEPVEMDESTPVELEFLLRLRGEQKFSSHEALKEQILKDVARAKRFFRLAG